MATYFSAVSGQRLSSPDELKSIGASSLVLLDNNGASVSSRLLQDSSSVYVFPFPYPKPTLSPFPTTLLSPADYVDYSLYAIDTINVLKESLASASLNLLFHSNILNEKFNTTLPLISSSLKFNTSALHSFQNDLILLKLIKIPPAILKDLSSNSNAEFNENFLPSLLDFLPMDRVYQWVDNCKFGNDQLLKKSQSLSSRITTLLSSTDAETRDCSLITNNSDVLRLNNLLLPYTTQKRPITTTTLSQLGAISQDLHSILQSTKQKLFAHITNITALQSQIASLTKDLSETTTDHEKLTVAFLQLDYIKRIPSAWAATIIEIVRRKIYNSVFLVKAREMAEILSRFRVLEERKRDGFWSDVEKYLPDALVGVKGLVESVGDGSGGGLPNCEISVSNTTDWLPGLTRSDVGVLENLSTPSGFVRGRAVENGQQQQQQQFDGFHRFFATLERSRRGLDVESEFERLVLKSGFVNSNYSGGTSESLKSGTLELNYFTKNSEYFFVNAVKSPQPASENSATLKIYEQRIRELENILRENYHSQSFTATSHNQPEPQPQPQTNISELDSVITEILNLVSEDTQDEKITSQSGDAALSANGIHDDIEGFEDGDTEIITKLYNLKSKIERLVYSSTNLPPTFTEPEFNTTRQDDQIMEKSIKNTSENMELQSPQQTATQEISQRTVGTNTSIQSKIAALEQQIILERANFRENLSSLEISKLELENELELKSHMVTSLQENLNKVVGNFSACEKQVDSLKSDLVEVTKDRDEKTKFVRELQGALAELREKVESDAARFKSDVDTLQREKHQVEAELAVLRDKVEHDAAQFQIQFDTLQLEKDQADEIAREKLDIESERFSNEIDSLNSRIESLQSEKNLVEEQLIAKVQELTDIRENTSREIDSLRVTVTDLTKANKTLDSGNETLKDEVMSVNKRWRAFTDELSLVFESLESTVVDAPAKGLDSNDSDLENDTSKYNSARQLENAKRSITQIQTLQQTIKTEHERIQALQNNHETEKQNLTSEITKFTETNRKLQQLVEEEKAVIGELEVQRETLQKEVEKLTFDTEVLFAKIEEEAKNHAEMIKNLAEENAQVSVTGERLNARVQELDAEKNELMRELGERGRDLEEARVTVERLELENGKLKKDIDVIDDTAMKLESELGVERERKRELQKSFEDLEDVNSMMNEELVKVKLECDNLKERVRELESKLESEVESWEELALKVAEFFGWTKVDEIFLHLDDEGTESGSDQSIGTPNITKKRRKLQAPSVISAKLREKSLECFNECLRLMNSETMLSDANTDVNVFSVFKSLLKNLIDTSDKRVSYLNSRLSSANTEISEYQLLLQTLDSQAVQLYNSKVSLIKLLFNQIQKSRKPLTKDPVTILNIPETDGTNGEVPEDGKEANLGEIDELMIKYIETEIFQTSDDEDETGGHGRSLNECKRLVFERVAEFGVDVGESVVEWIDKLEFDRRNMISFYDFKVDDLVLFLPTKNPKAWGAFNVSKPYHFLHPEEFTKFESQIK
ncbi:hypothetical protein HK098_004878 [Nowakowskiella sp. JEL0407]|nr:hypothetical protein HK098_004878 [Nowakowskiella sp. JEL0407]